MQHLSSSDLAALLCGLGVLLCAARLFGELAKRLSQPSILGEILAGIALGPTVLGRVAPGAHALLFPASGPVQAVHAGLTVLAITFFLLVAGMEVDLSTVWRQGRAALLVGLLGMLVPFAAGFAPGWYWPQTFGAEPGAERLGFALFLATALSISALPVIAKTLIDLGLYRTDLGMLIVAAAVLTDLVGWVVFAGVLGRAGANEGGFGVGQLLGLAAGFALLVLVLGRPLLHRVLPWISQRSRRSGNVLSFAIAMALLCAAFTQWIGMHAVFGAFLFGVALGDSSNLREETRATMERFTSYFFAPLFFAGIGLRVDFARHFDAPLAGLLLVIACVGKLLGSGLGARLGGLGWRETLAVGAGMNARGAMEIVVGILALQAGLIGERMFVALVILALVTSLASGPAIQALVGRRETTRRFTDFLTSRTFLGPLSASDATGAIRQLAAVAAMQCDLPADAVADAVLARETTMSTGLPNAVAIPHARFAELTQPVLAVGTSSRGLDFDTPTGVPVHVVVLILTPSDGHRSQLEILADVARTFRDPDGARASLSARNLQEFLDVVAALRGAA